MKPRVELIVFVLSLRSGGAERVLDGLLSRLGAGVVLRGIVCLSWTGDERLKGRHSARCPVVELRGHPTRFAFAEFWSAVKLVIENPRAILQGWMYHGCLLASLFGMLCPTRRQVAWSIHASGQVVPARARQQALSYRLMGVIAALLRPRILYCGVNSRRYHESFWRWPNRLGCILTNGIDLERFKPSATTKAAVRREFGIGAGELVLGYIGRWHSDKNVENLCQALAQVGPDSPPLVAVFCGPDLDRKNVDLAAQIPEGHSRVRCLLIGEYQDTSALVPGFDLLCLCSLREAFPLVLCEALAAGVPCVATDVGDCRFIVGKCGEIVPPGDSGALAVAIENLAGRVVGPDARRLSSLARSHAEQELDETVMTARYRSLVLRPAMEAGVQIV